MAGPLTFWFDYLSPYAWFASRRIEAICARHDTELVLQPVLFVALLRHWGHKGPAEIPSKKDWTFRDVRRYAAQHGISLQMPDPHPFNPLTALRVSLREVAGPDQARIVAALYAGAWEQGRNLGDDEVVEAILTEAGLDGAALVAATQQPEAKAALRAGTEAALAAGLFGVPTFTVDDELFWGNDRLDHVELYLAGKDPLRERR